MGSARIYKLLNARRSLKAEVRAYDGCEWICGDIRSTICGSDKRLNRRIQNVNTPSTQSQPNTPSTNLRKGVNFGEHRRVVVGREKSKQGDAQPPALPSII